MIWMKPPPLTTPITNICLYDMDEAPPPDYAYPKIYNMDEAPPLDYAYYEYMIWMKPTLLLCLL